MSAIYAGSFDPPTNGHLDIIRRAAGIFDQLEVVIADNPRKSYFFNAQERLAMIREMFDIMYAHNGIGLAANQVDLPYRFFVINLEGDPAKAPEYVFLNPEIGRRILQRLVEDAGLRERLGVAGVSMYRLTIEEKDAPRICWAIHRNVLFMSLNDKPLVHVLAAAVEALQGGATRYTATSGTPALRRAIAHVGRRRRIEFGDKFADRHRRDDGAGLDFAVGRLDLEITDEARDLLHLGV